MSKFIFNASVSGSSNFGDNTTITTQTNNQNSSNNSNNNSNNTTHHYPITHNHNNQTSITTNNQNNQQQQQFEAKQADNINNNTQSLREDTAINNLLSNLHDYNVDPLVVSEILNSMASNNIIDTNNNNNEQKQPVEIDSNPLHLPSSNHQTPQINGILMNIKQSNNNNNKSDDKSNYKSDDNDNDNDNDEEMNVISKSQSPSIGQEHSTHGSDKDNDIRMESDDDASLIQDSPKNVNKM